MNKAVRFLSLPEREILRILYTERRPLSFNELAKMSQLSWATTRKYVKKLEDKTLVKIYNLPNMKNPKAEFNLDLLPKIFPS